jgi:hypothetical protein
MRLTLLTCCAILTFVAVSTGQSPDDDPYSTRVVKDALSMRSGGRMVIRSWSQRGLSRLGDEVSIALLKMLDDSDLANPQVVRDLLPIVRDAFAEPQFIAIKENKEPKVTLFFLGSLRRNLSDTQTGELIDQTIEYVKGQGPR